MESFLVEKQNLKVAFAPVDLNTAAVTGARVGLSKGDRVSIILNLGASTAAVVQVSLEQHNAASAGTSKALSISNMYFVKAGAATTFTKVEPTVGASTFDVSTSFADAAGILVLEVLAEDLDVTNNFNHISVNVADSTAAKISSGMYVLSKMRFAPAYSQSI